MTKLSIMALAIAVLSWNSVNAQIYSQGKNLNNLNVYSIDLEKIKKQNDPSIFYAKVDFYGKKNKG